VIVTVRYFHGLTKIEDGSDENRETRSLETWPAGVIWMICDKEWLSEGEKFFRGQGEYLGF
jgi:hypothetical protein